MGALIDGYKTYILLAIGGLVVLANHFVGPVPGVNLPPSDWLSQLYDLFMVAAGRSALTKVVKP